MPYVPALGHALLISSGTVADPDKMHLFVIVSDKCPLNTHMLVSISRIKEGVYHDPSCVIEPGEHPFITERSFVAYHMARTLPSANLTKCVDGWVYRQKEDISPDLLKRIQDGILKSPEIPRGMRRYFQDSLKRKPDAEEKEPT